MGSPIISTDFAITNLSGDLCGEFQKMLSVAAKLQVWFDWAFDEYGNATEEFKALFVSIGVPVGMVGWYPTQVIPAGWLLCNGQAVSRTTYAALFTAIGTANGVGDGSTTFNLPNLEGKFLLGSNVSYGVGAIGGEENHTLSVGEMPAHDHKGVTGGYFLTWPYVATDAQLANMKTNEDTAMGFNPTTSKTGGGLGHNNMPPYKAGLWVIKY